MPLFKKSEKSKKIENKSHAQENQSSLTPGTAFAPAVEKTGEENEEITPEIKTVIMRCGGRFLYPQDKDIKRYRYPDQSEMYDPSKGEYANIE